MSSRQKMQTAIYTILRFEDIKAAAFAQTVDYKIDLSELYKYDSAYYLTILVDVEGFPERYPAWLLAKMREFADDSDITRAVLQEHGHLLLVTDAVSGLQKVECL